MSSPRFLEVLLGVAALVSVISVPVPKRDTGRLHPAHAHIDLRKIEELQRVSQTQRAEVTRLTRDTQSLAEMIRSQRDGGTVAASNPRPRNPSPENEYECSQ